MNKSRLYTISIILLLLVAFVSCTSTKNTAGTRWYHAFNTRFNIYFNGNEAYQTALKAQIEGHQESYSDFILMYPVSALPKDKEVEGGPFDRAIEKGAKAIKTRSIRTKPARKAGKRNDPKWQLWMAREEYNPFLFNAWFLMGRSQFYNGDFLTAASTFSYMTRHYATQPEIVAEARIWQARCYSEIGWYVDAENLLSRVNNENFPKNKNSLFASVYADLLIKQKRYNEAIPYLNTAIKGEKNGRQRLRMTYLLGQIYAFTGQNNLAFNAFGKVARSSAPYPMQFAARIRQTEVLPSENTDGVMNMLRRMSRNRNNKDYLDQIHHAWGNVYMAVPDTANAIKQFKLGVEKSTQNGFDKALSLISLGDIFFQQRKYVEAQPFYSEALGLIKKEFKDFARVSKRSEVLDELGGYVVAAQLQDSLQTLAQMPEEKRLAVIDKIIQDLIKQEEEARKDAEREEYLAQQQANRENMEGFRVGQEVQQMTTPGLMPQVGGDPFYFYNPQMVSQGKAEFQRKWGQRKLEDNWRLRNKAAVLFSDELAENQQTDGQDEILQDSSLIEKSPEELAAANDPKNREFYLQQIPFTEEQIAASNDIWMDALFNMGVIYKDKLEDYPLAIETFDELNRRFPNNEFRLDSYFQMYLMHLRKEDRNLVNVFKSKIRAEFPESTLAIAMSDPNYEYNMRMIDVIQDSIYRQTYEYYISGNPRGVRKNFEFISIKYPQTRIMPQFMFLNALSYAQTHDAEMFKEKLKELLEKYPEAITSDLASEMMKRLLKGLTLSGDGNLARGGIFNLRFGGETDENGVPLDSTIVFSAEKNAPHLLLMMYPANQVNGNVILFTVAGFNFSTFMVSDFDLQIDTFGETGMFQIRGFNNFREVMQYYEMINRPEGYMHSLDNAVIVVPMSVENYDILLKGRSLKEYVTFFEENFGEGNQHLIDKWNAIQEEEIDSISEEPAILEDPVIIEEEVEEKAENESLISIPQDTIISIPQDTVPEIKGAISEDEVMEKANEVAGKASETFDAVNETLDEIANDPIRGIMNLFSKPKKSNAIDEYVKEQEKKEKEKQKQLDEERKAKEKAQKELEKEKEKERKELLKKQQEEEKAILKAKQEQEKANLEEKKREQKAKEDARKQLQKEREEVRKQKQADAKVRQKQREADRKAREKARKEAQKLKEKQRAEERKRKEAERKARTK